MTDTPPPPRDRQDVEAGGGPPGAPDDLTLAAFGAILRRHRVLVAVCVLASVALVGAYTALTTPVFEATSVLRFEPEQVNLPQLMQALATENEIGTEIEVLRGRSAAEAVIDSLGLRARLVAPRRAQASRLFAVLRVAADADTATLLVRPDTLGRLAVWRAGAKAAALAALPGDTVRLAGVTLELLPAALDVPELELRVVSLNEALRSFEASLNASRPARDADLIAVRVRSADPVRATAAANLLAEQLIWTRQSVRMARTGSTVTFLQQQLDTLGAQLETAEDALRAYRQRAGVVNAEEQVRSQVGSLVQVEAERGGVQAERDALAMLLKQMRSDSARAGAAGEAPSRRLISFPTLFRNQAASQLLGALAQVENERSALLTRRTADDPDVQTLTTRVHELDAQLQGIAETYLQGLTNQVASLDEVVRRSGQELSALPAKEVQAARLEREVRVRQELYTLLQTRLKEAQITQAMIDPTVRIVDKAAVPDKPVRPNVPLNLALALVLGALLGTAGALGREMGDHPVRSRRDATQATGLPILAAIPRLDHGAPAATGVSWRLTETPHERLEVARVLVGGGNGNGRPRHSRNGKGHGLVTLKDAPGAYAEAFNLLHAHLSLRNREHPLKTVVLTSPLPGDGKTLSAVNFALALAARHLRVLLVDADLRRGLVHEVFGCARDPGFAELLTGAATLEDSARHVTVGEGGSLAVLPSGAHLRAPERLLAIDRVREVLATLAPEFDVVLVDSPPVNLLADAALLASAADGVLLVVRTGHTRIEALRYAADQLAEARAPVLGTVLNDVDPRRDRAYDRSYRYLSDVDRYYRPRREKSGSHA